jgi:hypothetical protein
MRAGPLSDTTVISLLNHYFVAVFVSNEDYRGDGSAPPEERAEHRRIYLETLNAHKSAGTVHVYLLKPDGHVLDSMHVAQAADTHRLTAMLRQAIDTLKTPEGKPVVKPAAQSVPPKARSGSLVLHLTARALTPGSWHEFPSENWLLLEPGRQARLLPSGPAKTGTAWEVDPGAAADLLTYFYPQTENNDVTTNRIEQQSLKARVLWTRGGVARARLDGSLRMKHAFYPHREDDGVVEAKLLGYMDFRPADRRLQSVHLVTESATYGRVPFGVAMRSLP